MHSRRIHGRGSVLAVLLTPVLVVGVVGSVAAQSAETAPVQLRFSWWGNPQRAEMTNQQVDLFKAAHPNIKVQTEPTVIEGYFDKRATEIAGGAAPDVMALGGSYPVEYGAAGALLDLTTVADILHLDAYSPSSYSAATVGDKVFGLPTGGNSLGLFINRDLITQAGVETPDDNTWTWDDFIAWSGELSSKLPEGVYGTDWRIAEAKGPFAAQSDHPLYTADGEVGLDEATVQQLFEVALALVANGGAPSAEVITEYRTTQFEGSLFGQGKAASLLSYTNQLGGYVNILGSGVDLIKIPGESVGSPGLTVLPSQFFGIYTNGNCDDPNRSGCHPQEAARLVDWLLNEAESQKIILANRGLSFNPAILEVITPLLSEADAKSAAYLQRVVEEGGPFIAPPAGSGEIDALWLTTEEEVLFGQTSPADAAAALVASAKQIVAANKPVTTPAP